MTSTLELTETISILSEKQEWEQVPGKSCGDGLAITLVRFSSSETDPCLTITHIKSGQRLGRFYKVTEHEIVLKVVEAFKTVLDWTQDAEAILELNKKPAIRAAMRNAQNVSLGE